MTSILGVLLIATVALASPVINNVQLRYDQLMKEIELTENEYNSLPDPKEQLYYMNAYSILRLSDHLKMNFDELQQEVLREMCGGTATCYGSPAFQKGVIKVCLHSDEYVSHQVELYENFTKCSDNMLTNVVNSIESTNEKMEELRYSKRKLMQEYSDEKSRYELEMVLSYHERIINSDKTELLLKVENLRNLYNHLEDSIQICSEQGLPRINKKLYSHENVQHCMRDFLTTEPKQGGDDSSANQLEETQPEEENQEGPSTPEDESNENANNEHEGTSADPDSDEHDDEQQNNIDTDPPNNGDEGSDDDFIQD